MISAASRSRVLRRSSLARSSGTPSRAEARNISAPENGAPSMLLLNSSMLTPNRVRACVTSRTMPGRSLPTSSSLTVLRLLGAGAALERDAQAGRLEIAQRARQVRDVRFRNFDQQDAREFARQMREPAIEPGSAGGGDLFRDCVHQPRSVMTDKRQHKRRLHGRLRREKCECASAELAGRAAIVALFTVDGPSPSRDAGWRDAIRRRPDGSALRGRWDDDMRIGRCF